MTRPWLLLDVSGLAYRSLYAMGDLSYEGAATGAIYGMFKSVFDLMELHATDRLVWCFDRGHGKRSEICRSYKCNRSREDKSEEEQEAIDSVREQLHLLRTEYLPEIGYKNICSSKGYEADDVIASICGELSNEQEAIIVSSDGDLLQLLAPNVSIWLPKGKSVTEKSFRDEWGIDPLLWADVKAIAGCSSDNVIGVRGVGEKTAVKFLVGHLKDTSKTYLSIIQSNDVWRRNLELVRLPFPGVGKFELQQDHVTREDWEPVLVDRLGMKSLRKRREGFKFQ